MDELDDNPWDWVWARLTDQDQIGYGAANIGGTPQPVSVEANYSNPLGGYELFDLGPGLRPELLQDAARINMA